MRHYTQIFWDFNGTILDDLSVSFDCANRLLSAHGLRPLSGFDEYREAFGFPIIDYYRRIGFDFSVTPYDSLAVEWVAYYNEEVHRAGLCPGVLRVLDGFRARGIPQILLSATEASMLRGQVRDLGLSGYFDEVIGQDSIHAYGKTTLAREWKEKHPDASVLLFGDTDHDLESARALGADVVLVASGHQPLSRLSSLGADLVIPSLKEWVFD